MVGNIPEGAEDAKEALRISRLEAKVRYHR
jgi:hypothetical protein